MIVITAVVVWIALLIFYWSLLVVGARGDR